MFRRRDKFDGPFFGGKRGRERRYGGGLIFGIVIGLRIWGGGYIWEDLYTGERINGILRDFFRRYLIGRKTYLVEKLVQNFRNPKEASLKCLGSKVIIYLSKMVQSHLNLVKMETFLKNSTLS